MIFMHENVIFDLILGFNLELRPSSITGILGKGVFVKCGTVQRGQIVCLYPGLVYQPHQPVLIASIRNAYIFR